MCSHCGHIQPMKLSDRVFCCHKCNHTLDRDRNASINLENAPDKKVSVGSTLTYTPVDKKEPTPLVEARS
ncbi:MAG: zinc ribbon domain-containing protein [Cyanobacteria bacterium J06635_10]